MHESLLNLLSTLSRSGGKTSEAKIALGSIVSLLILIGIQVAVQWTEKSESNGTTVVIVSSVLAMITASKWYADKRTETKGRIADMIGNPEVASLLRDALLPPARGLNSASPFSPVIPPPVKLEPRQLEPRVEDPIPPPSASPPSYQVILTLPDGSEERTECPTRLAACEMATKLRAAEDLPPGTKVHVA